MTSNRTPASERELLASMRRYGEAFAETERRVRRINRRLRRRNLQLQDGQTGWAVIDRYSTLCEPGAMDLTLDQAEAWVDEHFSTRHPLSATTAASHEASAVVDRAQAVADFFLSQEVKRLGSAAAVQRVIDERWPALTEDEMERVISLVANTPLASWGS